jgi:hypothetical protein
VHSKIHLFRVWSYEHRVRLLIETGLAAVELDRYLAAGRAGVLPLLHIRKGLREPALVASFFRDIELVPAFMRAQTLLDVLLASLAGKQHLGVDECALQRVVLRLRLRSLARSV